MAIRPPEIVTTLSLGHVFRFNSSNAFTSVPITRAMLLNLVSMATTTTNQFRTMTAIKLKRIRMWGQPAALGSANTRVVCEWVGNQGPSTIHTDTASGVRPSYVDTRPPADSSDRWWSISGSNETEVLCKLTGQVGTIIDVHASIRMADNEAGVAAENGTAAGASVGHVYFNYLDGFASKILTPEGGVTALP